MGLYVVEIAQVAGAAVLDSQLRGFLVDVVVTVSRIRMIAHPLRAARTALLLDRPEHIGHIAGIVAGPGHDVRAQQIGLTLVLAAEPEERGADAELRALRDHRSCSTTHDGTEHGA